MDKARLFPLPPLLGVSASYRVDIEKFYRFPFFCGWFLYDSSNFQSFQNWRGRASPGSRSQRYVPLSMVTPKTEFDVCNSVKWYL